MAGYEDQARTSKGRWSHRTNREPAGGLSGHGDSLQDRARSQDPFTRSEALLDPDCPEETVRWAAEHDADPTVRLMLTDHELASDLGSTDPHPAIRALALWNEGLDADEMDPQSREFLRLIAA